MNMTARLDELLGRASKITDGQAKEAATILLSLYSETQDKSRVADYLMKLKSTVCLFFFETAVTTLDPETQIQSIHSAICSTEAYKKNANHAATSRGFIISAVLIKNGVNIARAILMRTLADVEKEGKFSDAVISNFKQYTVDYCGSLESIKALGEKTWNKPESRNRFIRFMEAVNENIVTIISAPKNDSTTITEPPVNTPVVSVPAVPIKEDKTIVLTSELLKTLENSNREAQRLFSILNESNGTIAMLREQVRDREACISKLNTDIRERDNIITNLRSDMDKARQEIDNQQSKIVELTEQLKTSRQMDTISQNQELITLKADLTNSLKLEYADYLNDKDTECNLDTFGAFRGSLTRIFKTLRRFGITLD